MCGIVGYLGEAGDRHDDRWLLGRMVDRLSHRGPDEKGFHVGSGMGLGHARLSIIDLAEGRQPMANAERTVWLVFNGEIFNHVELRAELTERGHRFRTRSDTEVILHLYEEKGVDCVDDLNGDFAFAIWDERCRQLMLARDRMGVRPLHYTDHGGRLYFASEIKALLTVPGIRAELDPIALDQIFTFWFPLSPRTAFRGIRELPPGHVLTIRGDRRELRRYWHLDFPHAGEGGALAGRGAASIAEELRALLLDATKIRLRSDVPVGAYLSGGLDSSIITAAVKRLVPERLRTFSVTFENAEFDERDFQQDMVRALDTQHQEIRCGGGDIAAVFPQVVAHAERPFLRTAPAPLFALSGLVHDQGYKVVLTGEGADEVFAGYDIFKEAKLRRFCARQPESHLRPLLYRRLYPYLPRLHDQSSRYLAAFFATGEGELADPLFSHLPRFKTTAGAKRFLSGEVRKALGDYDALAEMRDGLPADFMRWHSLSRAQYLETVHLLPGYILSTQGDRMSMAHSVEGRYPFLDHRLVEFAAQIPPAMKIRALREKHILRESVAEMLPEAIARRPKQPYRAPDSQSFVGAGVPAPVIEALSPAAIAEAGHFDPMAVARLVDKCRRNPNGGARDNMAFVGILSTQLWQRSFVGEGQGEPAVGRRVAMA